jgi:hypothetical protein
VSEIDDAILALTNEDLPPSIPEPGHARQRMPGPMRIEELRRLNQLLTQFWLEHAGDPSESDAYEIRARNALCTGTIGIIRRYHNERMDKAARWPKRSRLTLW